ncbi:unnamed protein product, partial [Musa banksii]
MGHIQEKCNGEFCRRYRLRNPEGGWFFGGSNKTLGRGVAHETGSDVIVERKFEVKVQLGSLGSAAHPSAAASTN